MKSLFYLSIAFLSFGSALAGSAKPAETCRDHWLKLSPGSDLIQVTRACMSAVALDACKSVNGENIVHLETSGYRADGKRILVFATIHGDEPASGKLAVEWWQRLLGIESRNTWRILPVTNPDGWALGTRMNANGVDLNRNFPSKDWAEDALRKWRSLRKSDPRRYPGPAAASEPETQCLVQHITEFNPDFIVSVHTPYGVLDFDGPSVSFPKVSGLPWVRIGTFPGSLGRFMWHDKNVPVLTVELKGNELRQDESWNHWLQDVTGTVAIRSKLKLQSNAKYVHPGRNL